MIKRRRRASSTPGRPGLRDVALAVAAKRGELGMTQVELAVKAGVGYRTVQGIESGRTKPHARTLAAIARVLDLNAAELWCALDGQPAKAAS